MRRQRWQVRRAWGTSGPGWNAVDPRCDGRRECGCQFFTSWRIAVEYAAGRARG